MRSFWLVSFSCFIPCMVCGGASAQWQPEWTGIGEHPHPPPVGMSPIGLQLAADGAVFAGINATHQNAAHAGALRFDSKGTFAWLNEREGLTWTTAGIERLSSGHIAIVGESFLGNDRSVFVRVIDSETGGLVWEREVVTGRLWFDEHDGTRQIVEAENGGLLIRLAEGGDYIVLRFAPDGTRLPDWRWPSGHERVIAHEIVATADGGAVVTGAAGIGEGFRTVRFDSIGGIVFADAELGEIGNALGKARVRIDGEGNVIVVASPETAHGVPGAMAWKIDPQGQRLWTTELSDQASTTTTFDNWPVLLAANQDVLVVAGSVPDARMRVMPLAADTGNVAMNHDSDIDASRVLTMALAGNGRVLLGGYGHFSGGVGGQVASRAVEFTADGQPCRSIEMTVASAVHTAVWHADGWYMLGNESDIGLYVRRYDATGPCEAPDPIFVDGFESAGD
jgi:hypothetical protein